LLCERLSWMKHIILIGFLFSSTIIPGFSQKVKYKSLFILLKAENYYDGDRYLRGFLKEEPEHPNANYHMGRMLQSYMAEQDLLNSSARIIELADSSLRYYKKALNITTEKYVKKHDDDYYAEFERRDMRSAKFIVKLSDVQLDMETRMAAVKKFKLDVVNLINHLSSAINLYDSSLNYYQRIKANAGSTNLLYFNSGPDELLLFRKLAARYDSSIYHFQTFQALMKDMGNGNAKQKLVEKQIEYYPLDSLDRPDFYATTVKLWNYAEWANSTEDVVLKQIYPLKKRMASFDERLKVLHNKIINDSLDARPEIFRLATENVARDIVNYDDSSLPAAIYNYRIAEINYHSAINYWHKVVADTSHVGVKLDVLEDLRKQQRGNVKLLECLTEANNASERLIFREFIVERYQDDNGMAEFIRQQTIDVQNDSLLLDKLLTETREEDKYAYWQSESIALEVGSQISNADSAQFSTVMIDSLFDRVLGFYAWMENAGSLALSFGISPSSRTLDTLYTVPIDTIVAADGDMAALQFLSDSIGVQKRVWVLNTTQPDNDSKYSVQVFTTNLTDGIGWNKEFIINDIPQAIKFNETNQSFTLTGKNEEPLLLLNENGEEQVIEDVEGGE
jgi:hypothetical protein